MELGFLILFLGYKWRMLGNKLNSFKAIRILIWRRRWHPTPILLPGESQGWRSLVGCSPWGCEESDMTERLHFHFTLSLYTFMHWRRKWQPTPVFFPGESQGRGSLVGCRLWGRRVGHDWSDLAVAADGYPLWGTVFYSQTDYAFC